MKSCDGKTVDGAVSCDLVTVNFKGVDYYGVPFNINLHPDDARRVIFALHRMLKEQMSMRQRVNEAHDDGKVA